MAVLPAAGMAGRLDLDQHAHLQETPLFLNFPMFVPSLSWQNDEFYI
jgi:hypothetical protein